MCSPKVQQVVRERVQREGLPKFSRRNLLKFGGVTAAGLAVASIGAPTRMLRAQGDMGEVIDLTHVFGENVPTFIPGEAPTCEDHVTIEANGYYIQRWNLTEHASTHVDAPAHFVTGAETIDVYAANLLVSPAVVIDIRAKAEENPDAMVEVADIEAWEAANGELPAGALVCMDSGWDARFSDVEAFRNADADGVLHFPGFSPEAAAFLIEERDIHGVGVDTLSLDTGTSTTFDVHYTILGAGKYGIEGLANLASIRDRITMVVVGVPRWEMGSGGPARILAIG